MNRFGALRVAACLTVAPLVLAACAGEDSELAVAQARVTEMEEALAAAQSAATAAQAGFCEASEDYILSLDRYGDLLTVTTTTVGDVQDAGKDLAQPRQDAFDGAEEAVAAQAQVAAARTDLAEAEAALAVARDPSRSEEPVTPRSPASLAPEATVTRVEQAETEFDAAQKGITKRTPLADASLQFNAAAVALEMSWLKLFAEAGCLGEQEQQAQQAVHDYTVSVQQALAAAGYYEDEVDGVYGPATVEAVEALQTAHDLPVTGAMDKATSSALETELAAKGGAAAVDSVVATSAVQQTLKLAGFWDGPVDGEWSPELTEALKEFQNELGVEPTGAVDPATVAAFEKALATAMAPASEAPPATEQEPSPAPSG